MCLGLCFKLQYTMHFGWEKLRVISMDKLEMFRQTKSVLNAVVGSKRFGYASSNSDTDRFFLTRTTDIAYHDELSGATYFLWSMRHIKERWGEPMLMGDLTADCQGDETVCAYLRRNRRELAYSTPDRSVRFGLEYMGAKESIGIDTAAKPALLTAFILSHMAEERVDPFVLSDDEKAVLIRARTGDVPPEERAEIYRRTICPANLDKLRRMPENTKVRDELFALLDKICKEETT